MDEIHFIWLFISLQNDSAIKTLKYVTRF